MKQNYVFTVCETDKNKNKLPNFKETALDFARAIFAQTGGGSIIPAVSGYVDNDGNLVVENVYKISTISENLDADKIAKLISEKTHQETGVLEVYPAEIKFF